MQPKNALSSLLGAYGTDDSDALNESSSDDTESSDDMETEATTMPMISSQLSEMHSVENTCDAEEKSNVSERISSAKIDSKDLPSEEPMDHSDSMAADNSNEDVPVNSDMDELPSEERIVKM